MAPTVGPFSSATEMLAALDAREISAVELVELHLKRIDAHNPALNAIVVPTPERALEWARRADEARAAGEQGALLGLPMTLKESTLVAGLPQSAGIEALKDYRPTQDGPIARSVFAAGVCLLGKTNIPAALSDWQADSPVYGRTNNPWDLSRTPGGSTGGGSAALASGMTPLEIGSDIAGSIRVPAAYCGLYGHRPSETAVPRVGSFPFADAPNPGAAMGVQGPLARTAGDLELLFDVIIGPVAGEDVAWRLDLPASRHERLADFRVAVLPPLDVVQPSAEMRAKVGELAGFLSDAGAKVDEAMPALDLDSYVRDYLTLLLAVTSTGQPPEARAEQARQMRERGDPMSEAMAEGATLDASGLILLHHRREAVRGAWRTFFEDWDVLVCPTALDVAFPHQTGDDGTRLITVDDREVPYMLNMIYPMLAVFPGQPATAFPAGLSAAGLPIGLEVTGPYLEDRTTLRFAQLLEREWRRFEPPPGY